MHVILLKSLHLHRGISLNRVLVCWNPISVVSIEQGVYEGACSLWCSLRHREFEIYNRNQLIACQQEKYHFVLSLLCREGSINEQKATTHHNTQVAEYRLSTIRE